MYAQAMWIGHHEQTSPLLSIINCHAIKTFSKRFTILCRTDSGCAESSGMPKTDVLKTCTAKKTFFIENSVKFMRSLVILEYR